MKKVSILTLLLLSSLAFGQDTLKIMTSNLLNYTTSDASRDQYYRTILRHVKPDVLVVQEMTSQAAVDNYYNNVVNLVFPGQFTKGTFILGTDTNNEIYYKQSKMSFVANTPIRTVLRDINEFKTVHTASAETLRVYSVHLKASNNTGDPEARAAEVDSLRKVTNALPTGKYFMVVGDFNIYGSTESAYQKLLQDNPTDDGHFVDAINITGTWNNGSYAPYHTQSTRVRQFGGGATGGMDDRFDMILFSRAIAQGGRISYVVGSMTPIGNDGLHYNDSINRLPNNAVPDSVANALHYASDHLPVSARFVFPTSQVPIQLASFTGVVVGYGHVRLDWRTISETNNYGFEVQRKANWQSEFESLPNRFVAGHGTTLEPHDYSFIDSTADVGSWSYRLKQIDLDGTVHFTDAIRVDVVTSAAENEPREFALYQNYPNPFNPSTNISFSVAGAGFVTLKVFDVLGREVASLMSSVVDAGKHEVRWDATGVGSGVYLYELSTSGFRQTKRMVLLR